MHCYVFVLKTLCWRTRSWPFIYSEIIWKISQAGANKNTKIMAILLWLKLYSRVFFNNFNNFHFRNHRSWWWQNLQKEACKLLHLIEWRSRTVCVHEHFRTETETQINTDCMIGHNLRLYWTAWPCWAANPDAADYEQSFRHSFLQ